jgi:hypothetical protein
MFAAAGSFGRKYRDYAGAADAVVYILLIITSEVVKWKKTANHY